MNITHAVGNACSAILFFFFIDITLKFMLSVNLFVGEVGLNNVFSKKKEKKNTER